MELIKVLSADDIYNICEKILQRHAKFPDEDLSMSLGVILMNYGDSYVQVRCVNGEWEGTKGQLTPRDGIPLCENGHPLLEVSEAPRLALVIDEEPAETPEWIQGDTLHLQIPMSLDQTIRADALHAVVTLHTGKQITYLDEAKMLEQADIFADYIKNGVNDDA